MKLHRAPLIDLHKDPERRERAASLKIVEIQPRGILKQDPTADSSHGASDASLGCPQVEQVGWLRHSICLHYSLVTVNNQIHCQPQEHMSGIKYS